jgi:hypothetical protein
MELREPLHRYSVWVALLREAPRFQGIIWGRINVTRGLVMAFAYVRERGEAKVHWIFLLPCSLARSWGVVRLSVLAIAMGLQYIPYIPHCGLGGECA